MLLQECSPRSCVPWPRTQRFSRSQWCLLPADGQAAWLRVLGTEPGSLHLSSRASSGLEVSSPFPWAGKTKTVTADRVLFSAFAFDQCRPEDVVLSQNMSMPFLVLLSPRHLFPERVRSQEQTGQLLPWQPGRKTFSRLAPILSDGPRTHAQMSKLGYRLF